MMENNNVIKYILTELHLQKRVTFWGKINCQFRCLPTTLQFVPFLKS